MKYLVVLMLLPVYTKAQVGESYKSYVHSEFADFFHTSEVARMPYKNGEKRGIKLGVFQDDITIYLYTDTVAVNIHEATLDVDREWLQGETGADLSRDLIKSFLLDFIAKADMQKAMPAGDLLFNYKATQDKFALDLQSVVNAKTDSMTTKFSKCSVSAQNLKQDDRTVFELKIAELAK